MYRAGPFAPPFLSVINMENQSFSDRIEQLRAAAVSYANKGWYVFPIHSQGPGGLCSCGQSSCAKPGKHPAVKWVTAKTTDHKKIEGWWTYAGPIAYNIGIATGKGSGITVVDIDAGKGGLQTWQDLSDRYHFPLTYTVRTGGGGLHLYFAYCPELKTGTDVLGPGIDIRNDGGYVVAAPSLHNSGQLYTVIDGREPVEVPESLISLKAKTNSPNAVKKNEVLSITRAARLLDFIPNDDYSTWFKVGIILGRSFSSSEQAWRLYQAWSDKNWHGNKDAAREKIMKDAFYKAAQDPQDKQYPKVTAGTLYYLAYKGGYTALDHTCDITLFCYLASENAFVFLPNGEKFVAAALNALVPAVPDDEQGLMKASDWLIENKSAISMISNGAIPNGLIGGYYAKNGELCPLQNAVVLNLFNHGEVYPCTLVTDINAPLSLADFEEEGAEKSSFTPDQANTTARPIVSYQEAPDAKEVYISPIAAIIEEDLQVNS